MNDAFRAYEVLCLSALVACLSACTSFDNQGKTTPPPVIPRVQLSALDENYDRFAGQWVEVEGFLILTVTGRDPALLQGRRLQAGQRDSMLGDVEYSCVFEGQPEP